MLNELLRSVQETQQEPVRVLRDSIVVLGNGGARAHEPVHNATERAETLAVVSEHQTAIPAHGFAEHGENRAVGIDGALRIQHFHRCFERIQNDKVFPGHVKVGNWTCTRRYS